ncbi:MAG: metallophosphoesterase [Promicromonosporaceae bacterium]|nr:metallophosphoesterase [Promicromonosporaceae bacterium]
MTIAVIPDTQISMTEAGRAWEPQVAWLVANAARLNLRFVLHVGDLVDKPYELGQWERAAAGLAQFRLANIPYAITPGNHDLTLWSPQANPPPNRTTIDGQPMTLVPNRSDVLDGDRRYFDDSYWRRFLPLEHSLRAAAGRAELVEVFPPETTRNVAYTLTASGIDLLLMTIEFGAGREVLGWARRVRASRLNHVLVIAAHDFIGTDGKIRGECGEGALAAQQGQLRPAEQWEQLSDLNVDLLLSGHVVECRGDVDCGQVGFVGRSTRRNAAGHLTQLLLANYQGLSGVGHIAGDSGYLRLLTFHPDRSEVQVVTYSPHLDRYLRDPQNNFTIPANL